MSISDQRLQFLFSEVRKGTGARFSESYSNKRGARFEDVSTWTNNHVTSPERQRPTAVEFISLYTYQWTR